MLRRLNFAAALRLRQLMTVRVLLTGILHAIPATNTWGKSRCALLLQNHLTFLPLSFCPKSGFRMRCFCRTPRDFIRRRKPEPCTCPRWIHARVSPLELSGAYCALSGGGRYTEPFAVTKIVSPAVTGSDEYSILYEHRSEKTHAMCAETAFIVTSMLRTAVDEGTAKFFRKPTFPSQQKREPTWIQAARFVMHGLRHILVIIPL